jgi:uncharacterized protein YidB (DUF937 family)
VSQSAFTGEPAEAVIEERVAEIQNLLQGGATWQAVDIWLSEGASQSVTNLETEQFRRRLPASTSVSASSVGRSGIIEERVAEIQNLLQGGATWQAVDIWLSEGDLLVRR